MPSQCFRAPAEARERRVLRYARSGRSRRIPSQPPCSRRPDQRGRRARCARGGGLPTASDQLLGMRARDYRAGGTGAVIHFAVGQCSLGAILVAQSQRGICAILLNDDPDALVRELQDQFPNAQLIGGDAGFENLVAQVVGFVEAPSIGLNLPLDVRGTAFQERVWQALREIPPGTTVSYAEIAERIGRPTATRAVAQACGANHIAIAIPCHRVVRRDGDIAGYRWGVDRKRELLRREAEA
uniref:DNA-O6-methylguanine--protein-cysteine S-methyltransferase n=1 Tax=Cupriavidus pinatubonensis (strain JMP 134 / LMG 1197) TaxID=264198 RepID=Q46S02_CUPPJ